MPNTLFFGARKQEAPFSLYRKETQMDQGKLERILKKMEERNLSQMIITRHFLFNRKVDSSRRKNVGIVYQHQG